LRLRRLLLLRLSLLRSRLLLLSLLRLFLLFAAWDLLGRSQNQVHGIAFHAWPKFDDSFVAYFFQQAFKHIPSQILVGHFATAKAQAGFYLVAFSQKAEHVVPLGNVIVLIYIDAELNFFQDNLLLVFLRGPLFLLILIEKFAIVHNAANRRDCIRRYLYQIKILFAGFSERFVRRHNAKLVTICINHANLSCANAIIHANKTFIDAILLKVSPQP